MQLEHKMETELLDFLAEKFLQQGRSISYTTIAEIPALRVTSESGEMFFLAFISSEETAPELPENLELHIPVLKKEEECRLLKILEEAGRENIKAYRLNLYDRHSFLSRQFFRKQMGV